MYFKKTVAVIIPVTKNKDSVFRVIQDIDATGYPDEITAVDAGADKATLEEIKRTRAKIVFQKKSGVGRAIRAGIRSTRADLIVVTEPNGTFRGKDLAKLLAYSEDFDTVFGSRTHVPLIGKGSGMTLFRRLVDDFFAKLIVLIFGSSNLTDVGCTFRLTNRKGWRKVAGECKRNDEIFLTQWLIAAAKNKVRFIEVPVNFAAPKESVAKRALFYLFKRATLIFSYILKAGLENLAS